MGGQFISSHILQSLELVGGFAFAISGALVGIQKRFDLVGIVLLAIVAAYGGGIMRDVLLGATPPAALTNVTTLVIPTLAAVATIASAKRWSVMPTVMLLFDAVGLAVFTVLGTVKSLDHHAAIGTAIALGAITGVGGGVVRDIIARQEPLAVSTGAELYSLPALAGAAITAALYRWSVSTGTMLAIPITAIFVVRALAILRNWRSPNIDHLLLLRSKRHKSNRFGVLSTMQADPLDEISA